MKIQIREKGKCFTIPLPNGLVFSSFVMKLALRRSGNDLTPEARVRLLGELKKLARRETPWELVRVESKNGEVISITL